MNYQEAAVADEAWSGRPALARVIRLVLWVLPLVGSLLFGFWVSNNYPPERLGLNTWVWWLGLAVLATALMRLIERVTRRLTPLTLLLRLSLIFPDEAPSRFSAALRSGTTTQTKKRIKAIQDGGGALDGDDSVAAQMLDLIALLSKHDKMTRGHAERVRGYTDLLAEEMGLDKTDAGKLRWAALLHDMGKLEVPAEILNKPGKPNDEEWATLQRHPAAANKHLAPIAEWLGEWRHAADGHHERWDGKGYPQGLAGKEIPYAARIVAVADAYDVMTSTRSYKKPLPPEVARQEIADKAGSQFDPEVARAFLNIGLGDLRRATGPLAWLAGLPGLRNLPLANTVTPVATNIVAATSAVVTAATGVVVATPPDLEAVAPVPVVAEPELAFTDEAPVPTSSVVPTTPIPTTTASSLPPTSPPPAPNERPSAGDVSFVLDDGSTVTLSLPGETDTDDALLLDGSDPENSPLTLVVDNDAEGGEVSIVEGSAVFEHDAGSATASFGYAVFDGELYSEPATVSFDVVPPSTTTSTTTAVPSTTTAPSTTTVAPTTTVSTVPPSTTTVPPNRAPTTADESVGVHEDDPAGTPVVQVKVSDPDAGDSHSFLIVGGNPDTDGDGIKPFRIDANGVIEVADTDDDIDFGVDGQDFVLLVGIADSGGLTALSQVEVAVQTRHTLSPWAHLVTVNEINSTNTQFVELVNQSGTSVDLSGWRITDGDVVANDLDADPNVRVDVTLPASTKLAGNGRALITDGPIARTAAELQVARDWNSRFSADHDDLYIWDADGALVAYMAWGDSSNADHRNDTPPIRLWNLWDPTFESALSTAMERRSISLAIDGGDPSDSACWEPTTSGEANGRCPGVAPTISTSPTTPFRYSPGAPNDVYIGPAPANQIINVHEDEPNGAAVAQIDFNDPDSSVFTIDILSGNIDADGDGTGPFELAPSGDLIVTDADDIDFGVAGQNLLLRIHVTDHTSIRAYFEVRVLTQSRHTKSTLVGSVLITEVNWQSQHLTPLQDEFIEIQNVGSGPVDLTGWTFADHDSVEGVPDANPMLFTVPAGPSNGLWPGQKAVLWLGPSGEADTDAEGASWVYRTEDSASLFHVGDDVWLHDANGALVAYMAFGDDAAPSSEIDPRPPIEAFSLWDTAYEDQLGTAHITYTQSVALAVDGDAASATQSACWEPTGSGRASARCPGFVHPTYDNDRSPVRKSSVGASNNSPTYIDNLLINQFATNNSAPSAGDFIELHNPTNHTINLARYELELAFDGVEQPAIPLGSGWISPGQFFLITTSSSALATSADLVLPVAALPQNIGIRLWHTRDASIWFEDWELHVDRVGTTERHDGDPSTPALAPAAPADFRESFGVLPLSPSNYYEFAMGRRDSRGGNCTDTDHNHLDFSLRIGKPTITPKSLASPPKLCGVVVAPTTSSSSLVISELWLSGRDNFDDEGVSIFNPTSATQSLVGLSVNYDGPNGASVIHTFTNADPVTELLPGQNVLLRRTIAPALPANESADITFGPGLGDAHQGRVQVWLADETDARIDDIVLDKISDGTTLPPLVSYVTRSWVRAGGGCVDTDSSVDDFEYRTLLRHRHSRYPLRPCP